MKQAFVFPGQGSQSVGMMGEFADHAITQSVFDRASAALGYDLLALVNQGPAEQLNQTEYTQPALLAASIACWEIYLSSGKPTPAFVAGHSLGEYSALVASTVLSLEDAVKLVSLRGQLMQAAVPQGQGAMAAILGLDDALVVKACADAAQGEVVAAVNFNSPGQVVIAGQAEAVARAIEACKAAGAKRALPLPVSVPSHCALMKPAADALLEAMQNIEFKTPSIPMINNVDVAVETSPDAIRSALHRQLFMPVRWVELVQHLGKSGVEQIIECGPGKVLCGLNKRILDTVPSESIHAILKEFSCS
jgi:[acyl-carrier-protein] S-malonyltransferase